MLVLDTVTKFVQLIKLAQSETGCGSETVRPPRLVLEGAEREEALRIIREGLNNRPDIAQKSTPFDAGAKVGANNGHRNGIAVVTGAR